MPEETTTNPVDEEARKAEEAKQSEIDKIMNELSQLGHKVTAAVQTVWESEERHKAEDEIRKALKLAGESIDRVAEEVRKSDITKDVQSQATRAAEAVQKSEITKQIKEGLLTGLRRINEELSELLDKSKAEEAAKSAGEAAAASGKAAAEAGEAAAEAASAVMQEAVEKTQDV